MASGVLLFAVIDLVLLGLNITIGEILGTSEATIVPNKDNPRTVIGVRHDIIYQQCRQLSR